MIIRQMVLKQMTTNDMPDGRVINVVCIFMHSQLKTAREERFALLRRSETVVLESQNAKAR